MEAFDKNLPMQSEMEISNLAAYVSLLPDILVQYVVVRFIDFANCQASYQMRNSVPILDQYLYSYFRCSP
jgi:hypothetical protein